MRKQPGIYTMGKHFMHLRRPAHVHLHKRRIRVCVYEGRPKKTLRRTSLREYIPMVRKYTGGCRADEFKKLACICRMMKRALSVAWCAHSLSLHLSLPHTHTSYFIYTRGRCICESIEMRCGFINSWACILFASHLCSSLFYFHYSSGTAGSHTYETLAQWPEIWEPGVLLRPIALYRLLFICERRLNQ